MIEYVVLRHHGGMSDNCCSALYIMENLLSNTYETKDVTEVRCPGATDSRYNWKNKTRLATQDVTLYIIKIPACPLGFPPPSDHFIPILIG
jgi:hypothetical protein